MKFIRIQFILPVALALAGDFSADAQSNKPPGETDYGKFSSFIADRNIFDPNRYPHNSTSTPTRTRTRSRTKNAGTPAITLVGTMRYEKGLFAFFNANDSDMKKILVAGGEIAGYTVKEISPSAVTLAGPDKKEFTMKMGDQLHQDGNTWRLSEDPAFGGSSHASEPAPAAENDNSTNTPAETAHEAPSANIEVNDILKKLMEKRAKENQ